jgi:hypothetical protein
MPKKGIVVTLLVLVVFFVLHVSAGKSKLFFCVTVSDLFKIWIFLFTEDGPKAA